MKYGERVQVGISLITAAHSGIDTYLSLFESLCAEHGPHAGLVAQEGFLALVDLLLFQVAQGTGLTKQEVVATLGSGLTEYLIAHPEEDK